MNRYITLCLIPLFGALGSGAACAQIQSIGVADSHENGTVALNGSYFKGYAADSQSILRTPVHWSKSEWAGVALLAGAAVYAYSLDSETREEVQEGRTSRSNSFAQAGDALGSGYVLAPVGALYLYGRFQSSDRAKETALLGLESIVVSGVFNEALKVTAHRLRPNTDHSFDSWSGPGLSLSNLSFPSGHSATAFSLATVIAAEYGDRKYIPPLAYGAAFLTAWSRLNDNAHWFSDVFVGSAIGYFTAREILHLHENSGFTILPVAGEKTAGLSIVRRF
jgi:hypothetical protein